MDKVLLRGLSVNCIVGIHEAERVQAQRLECDITVGFSRRPGQFGASLTDSIDYARLEGTVRFVLEQGHFFLLEDAAEALCSTLLGAYRTRPASCSVELRKPQALGERCLPAISIDRLSTDFSPAIEHNHFGIVDILHEGPACGVYLLRIPAGGAIPSHVHLHMAEAELILDGGLRLNGEAVSAGLAHVWPTNFIHRYDNPSSEEATVLCIDRPRFSLADEILIDEPATLASIAPYSRRYFDLS